MKANKIGLGCWAFGQGLWQQDQRDSIKTIHHALRLGIRDFDTAQSYGKGKSEQVLTQQLRRFSNEINRSELSIATKITLPHKADQIKTVVNRSLKRMELTYLDILYIHWPDSKKELAPYLKELLILKEQKLIKTIGLSNFPLPLLKEAYKTTNIDYIQIPLSLLWIRSYNEVKQFCKEHKIKIVTYSPLGVGLLSGKYRTETKDWRNSLFPFKEEYQKPFQNLLATLEEVSKKENLAMATVALAWVLNHPINLVLTGSRTKEQLSTTLEATKIDLSNETLSTLNEAASLFDSHIDPKVDNLFFHTY
jgi:myo-inositol catabolism protein IolS